MALTFPSSPSNGQYYTDTATGNRYVYNSSVGAWIIAANNVGMSVSSTPPGNVAPGALWYNREIGRTFLYYDDGDSKQWVETVPATGFFDSSTVASYANVAAQIYLTPAYNTANAAYDAANNVGPQIAPTFNTANAAFAKANSALANTTNVVFQGNLTVTGALTIGTGTTTITTNSINVGNVLVVTSQGMTIPSGNTAQRPASAVLGTLRYNTQTASLENYISTGWAKVSAPTPIIASISGTIYNGAASTLTISGSNFGSSANVIFKVSGSTIATSTVTPTGGGTSISVSVPSAVYGQSVSTTVNISIVNDDLMTSAGSDKTVTALPSGGTITTSGNYRIHAFYSSGTFVNTLSNLAIEYMIIAGGGGGGSLPGGGGAGGYLSGNTTASVTSYSIVIGGGGVGGAQGVAGGNGSNSTGLGLTAVGGGGGGSHTSGGTSTAGTSGGSGGGGSDNNNVGGPGSGTVGQGYAGGNGCPTYGYDPRKGGGGGGAGQAGYDWNASGNGGNGVQNSILGTSYWWAGGGGAGVYSGTGNGGNGGKGGGGGGSINSGVNGSAGSGDTNGINAGGNGSKADGTPGGSGGTNTGGGSGCNSWATDYRTIAQGGSGIAVIRYLINNL